MAQFHPIGGGGGNPCTNATPEINASYGCGGVVMVPVEGMGTERSQRVTLASLPAGQYAYQLVVDGQLAASPQRLTVKP